MLKMDKREQEVLNSIEEMRDEIIDILSELIRIPSISPEIPGVSKEEVLGGESKCNEALSSHYSEIGCEVDLWEKKPKRANLVGVLKGNGGGRSLIFNGHIDTVPPGDYEDWKWGDPFSGELENGKIYGRGACDMKGGIVAQFAAAKALISNGVRLKGDLILQSVVGEESMDHKAGTSETIARGYKADAAVVAEPSSYPLPLTISPASPGMLYMTVTVKGKPTHPGIRAEFVRAGGKGDAVGVNAVEKGQKVLRALQELERIWGFKKEHPFFRPGYFTIHPGVIIGGPPGPLVPFIVSSYCRIEYIIWYPPDENVEDVKKEIASYIEKAAALDPWLTNHQPEIKWENHWPPFEIQQDHPIISSSTRAYKKAARFDDDFRNEPNIHGFAAVCDATFLDRNGIPAVVFGPGDVLVAHTVDEYVLVRELMLAAKVYALMAMDWCGVE